MIQPAFEILNQRGTPMFFSDVFANRPTAGIVGRIFISTDTKEFYRDTGTTWELLSGTPAGVITGSGTATQVAYFTGSSTIASKSNLYFDATNNRLGINNSSPAYSLDVVGNGIFLDTQTYSSGALRSLIANQTLTISGAVSSSTSISTIEASGTTLVTTPVTIPNSTQLSNNVNSKSVNFSGTGSLTLTQGSGGNIRAVSSLNLQSPFGGTISGTISHYASMLILGLSNSTGGLVTPVITNAYGLVINDLNEYSHSITLTNRWGIYQVGSSDKNYFAANTLIGSLVDNGNKLQVNGSVRIESTNGVSALSIVQATRAFYFTCESGGGAFNSISGSANGGAGNGNFGFTIQSGFGFGVGTTNSLTNSVFQVYPTGAVAGTIRMGTASTSGFLSIGGSVTASSSIARGVDMASSLVAAANGDSLVALDINPTFTNGAFIGVNNIGLRVNNGILVVNNTLQFLNAISQITTNAFFRIGNISNNTIVISPNNTDAFRFFGSGNFSINQGTDAGFKFDCNGTGRFGNNLTIQTGGLTVNSGNSSFSGYIFVLNGTGGGLASAVGNGALYIWNRLTNISGTGILMGDDFNGCNGNNMTANIVNIGGSYQMTGTSVGNTLSITREIKITSGTSTIRGFYYNPTLTSMTGVTHIAFQNVSGNNLLNTTSGNTIIGSTTDQGTKLYLNGSFRIDGQTSGTAGGSSGQHLIINCDGTTYKIALLNN